MECSSPRLGTRQWRRVAGGLGTASDTGPGVVMLALWGSQISSRSPGFPWSRLSHSLLFIFTESCAVTSTVHKLCQGRGTPARGPAAPTRLLLGSSHSWQHLPCLGDLYAQQRPEPALRPPGSTDERLSPVRQGQGNTVPPPRFRCPGLIPQPKFTVSGPG